MSTDSVMLKQFAAQNKIIKLQGKKIDSLLRLTALLGHDVDALRARVDSMGMHGRRRHAAPGAPVLQELPETSAAEIAQQAADNLQASRRAAAIIAVEAFGQSEEPAPVVPAVAFPQAPQQFEEPVGIAMSTKPVARPRKKKAVQTTGAGKTKAKAKAKRPPSRRSYFNTIYDNRATTHKKEFNALFSPAADAELRARTIAETAAKGKKLRDTGMRMAFYNNIAKDANATRLGLLGEFTTTHNRLAAKRASNPAVREAVSQ